MERHECPICGGRILPPTLQQTRGYWGYWGRVYAYYSNTTSPVCMGHSTPVPQLSTLYDQVIVTPGYHTPVEVPQAFYDAWQEEEDD